MGLWGTRERATRKRKLATRKLKKMIRRQNLNTNQPLKRAARSKTILTKT